MRCGGWRIFDPPAAEMKNPLMKISGFFFLPENDRSHALRGNASRDALRHILKRNAERPWRHSHAERGNDRARI